MFCFIVVVEKVVVRYLYSVDNEDEFSLKENEIIVIFDKEFEDVGWWKGEFNGKVGVFLDNFVEFILVEEVNLEKYLIFKKLLCKSYFFFVWIYYVDCSFVSK